MLAALLSLILAWGSSTPFLEVLNAQAGQRATLALSNAQPFSTARIGWSIAGPGPTQFQTPLGTIDAAFGSPYTLSPPLPVDSLGLASWTRRLPANSVGIVIYAQAVVYAPAIGLQLSNSAMETVQ